MLNEVANYLLRAIARELNDPRTEQEQPPEFVSHEHLRRSDPPTYTSRVLALIPISDANPTRRFPIITVTLIILNVVAFFTIQPDFGTGLDAEKYFVKNVALPCQLEDRCPPAIIGVSIPDRDLGSFTWAMVLSTFLHAGFLHIGGNMLFLWIFGNNVEDFLGRFRYLLFYLAGGLAASLTQVFTHLGSAIPAVGASGAVAAVMGAYFVLYPRARVNVLVPIFFLLTVTQMSAWIVLGLWFAFQFLLSQPGVAWQAHAGGFVFGILAILLLGGRPHRPQFVWQPRPGVR